MWLLSEVVVDHAVTDVVHVDRRGPVRVPLSVPGGRHYMREFYRAFREEVALWASLKAYDTRTYVRKKRRMVKR